MLFEIQAWAIALSIEKPLANATGVSKREYVRTTPLSDTNLWEGRNCQTPFAIAGRLPLPLESVALAQSIQSYDNWQPQFLRESGSFSLSPPLFHLHQLLFLLGISFTTIKSAACPSYDIISLRVRSVLIFDINSQLPRGSTSYEECEKSCGSWKLTNNGDHTAITSHLVYR